MRKILITLIAISLTLAVFAQAPDKMNYQAVIRDASDNLVTNNSIGMQISILQGSATGTPVYRETQTPTTNANGLVSIQIGTGTTSDDFSAIDWSSDTYFIKTETDPAGGSSYNITGTSQLLSTPYALYAKSAGNVAETDPVYTASQAANITADDITNLGNLSGSNTGDQDGSETKVTAGTNVTITGTGTTVSPYVVSATGGSSAHYVGELFEGGIVFYVDQAGQHGFICSMIDVSVSQSWSNVTASEVGVLAQSYRNGQVNTNAIIGQTGHVSSAAKICDDYSNIDYGTGIYSDWYLPAIDELILLYYSIYQVGDVLENDGNSGTTELLRDNPSGEGYYYWSSTEIHINGAGALNVRNGDIITYDGKSAALLVKTIL
jgi:hypothetical protein